MGFPPGGISNDKSQKNVNVAYLGVSLRKKTLRDGKAIRVVGVEGVNFKDEGEDMVD